MGQILKREYKREARHKGDLVSYQILPVHQTAERKMLGADFGWTGIWFCI